MNKIIVEVGSTCIKVDKFNGNNIEKLNGKIIQFKKHYNEDKKLRERDIQELIKSINDLKSILKDIYICGTSIFLQERILYLYKRAFGWKRLKLLFEILYWRGVAAI